MRQGKRKIRTPGIRNFGGLSPDSSIQITDSGFGYWTIEVVTRSSFQYPIGYLLPFTPIGSNLPSPHRARPMADMDPIEWDVIEAVVGPPAPDLQQHVDDMTAQVADEKSFTAVKTVYDTWKSQLGAKRTLPDQGAAMLVTYLLERAGAIDLGPSSIVDRRPSSEHLEKLFSDREYTMWWIATLTGVHWVVVRYWLWEDDISLRERNFSTETMEKIRAHESEEQ